MYPIVEGPPHSSPLLRINLPPPLNKPSQVFLLLLLPLPGTESLLNGQDKTSKLPEQVVFLFY
jgi:hypothetical protein